MFFVKNKTFLKILEVRSQKQEARGEKNFIL